MRRRARECALQILYQLDAGGLLQADEDGCAAVERYWNSFEAVGQEERAFAERLVSGVSQRLAQLDETLQHISTHWKLARMASVDRNLLRLGAYEILYCPDIPRNVSIDEAVELGKRFSGPDSPAFLNGILDKLGTAPAA